MATSLRRLVYPAVAVGGVLLGVLVAGVPSRSNDPVVRTDVTTTTPAPTMPTTTAATTTTAGVTTSVADATTTTRRAGRP